MEIITTRAVIRPLRVEDLGAFAALTGDPESMRFMGDGTPLSRAETENWIPVTHANDARDGWTTWAAADRSTDEFLGFVGLIHGSDEGSIEVTYALAPAARGTGLASELVAALTAFAFEDRGLTELFATIDPRNAGSQRVVEKAGYLEISRRVDKHGQEEILYRAGRVTQD